MELLTYKDRLEEYTYYLKEGKEVLHGLYKDWYKRNGKLEYESHYKDGKRYGLSRHWKEDGQLEYEVYWKEGIKYKSKEEYEEQLITNKDW